MKKLIALAVLLALCMPAWAVTTVYDTAPTSQYPALGSSGEAALVNASDWTLGTGLLVNGPYIELDRYEEAFNNNSIDSTNIGTSVSGAGAMKENSVLVGSSPTAGTDGAIWYYKTAVSRAGTDIKIVRAQVAAIPASQNMTIFGLQQRASSPVVGDSATLDTNNTILKVLVDPAAGQMRLNYYTNGGTFMYWDGATWTSGGGSVTGAVATEYEVRFQTNGTQWRLIVIDRNSGAAVTTTDYVNWSGTRDDGANPTWLFGGDYYSNVYTGTSIFSMFADAYSTSSPTATMGNINVNCEITNIPITEDNGAGGSITWDYDIGGGWVTGKTFSQLESALIGQQPGTLNLRSNHVSDGFGQSKFYLTGSSLCN